MLHSLDGITQSVPTGLHCQLEFNFIKIKICYLVILMGTDLYSWKKVMCFIVTSCYYLHHTVNIKLTHLSLASFLWDIGKQNSPRCDAAERGIPSGAILFAWRNFIEKTK